MSFIFYSLQIENWRVVISENTVFLIIMSLIFFMLGSVCSSKRNKKNEKLKIKIRIPKFYLNCIVIYSILIFILYFKEVYELSKIGGNNKGIEGMIFYARHAILSNIGKISYYISISIFFIKSFVLILIYEVVKKYIKNQKIDCLKRKITIFIIYIGIIILSTGRTEFIYLIVYLLNIYSILYFQKFNWNKKINYKIMRLGVVSFILFLVIFSIIGYLRNSNQQETIFNMISIYVGSSIPALDIFLKNFDKPNGYFGSHTLAIFYKLLLKLGWKVPELYGPCEFVWFNPETKTNVYTALKRYIEDYDILGLFVIMFILGYIYTFFFNKCYYEKNSDFNLICYSILCYPLYEISIEERVLTTILTTGTIYTIIFIYFFYKNFQLKNE